MTKKRNPVARALRAGHLKPKRVKPAKGKGAYQRLSKRAARRLSD